MSPEEALHILGPLADALATLHSRGVVHRDVKPANIMITEDGPILMDFGVVQTDRFPEQTTSGQFLGTIRYGAPEYLFGEASTMLADVFAFGAIAYELFFGDVFLGGEQHWARQIARKASWPQGPSSEDYQALAARVGLRYAELAKFICDRALAPAKRRDLNLAAFAAAIASGAVRQPFTVDDGRLQPGTGRWPRIAGMECTATDCAPEDIALHIQRVLSGSELEYLLGLLEGSYWKGYVVADVSDRRLLRLETLDILERGDIGGFTAHFFRPGVTAAYRYGLLRPHRR